MCNSAYFKMDYISIGLLLILTCIMKNESSITTYVSPDGLTCIKCYPGTHLVDHCKENNVTSKCVLCPNGTFSSTPNQALSCEPCRTYCLSKTTVPVKPCTRRSNMECDCPNGTRNKYPSYPEERALCIADKPCPAGYGVVHSDPSKGIIECEECIYGKTFSSTFSSTARCQQCTECEKQSIRTACNITHDVVCIPENTGSVAKAEHKQGIDSNIIVAVVVSIVVFMMTVLVIVCAVRRYKNKRLPSDDSGGRPVYRNSTLPEPCEEGIKDLNDMGYQENNRLPNDEQNAAVTQTSQPDHSLCSATNVYTEKQLQRMFSFISNEIELKWEEFLRHLLTESGSVDADTIIQRVKINNDERELQKEIAYRCLLKWKELFPKKVNQEFISAAFLHFNMHKSMASFKTKFSSSTGIEETSFT